MGYIFSHPWLQEKIVELDEKITLPEHPDCYYIHDLAIAPECRGQGVGTRLYNSVIEVAKKMELKKIKLVSVLDSHIFWKKLGLKIIDKVRYTPEIEGLVMIGNI